jgi:hypothetical protein
MMSLILLNKKIKQLEQRKINMTKRVDNAVDFEQAILTGEAEIVVTRAITLTHAIQLAGGVTLRGKQQEDGTWPLVMFTHSDGIGLSVNNTVKNLRIQTVADQRALFLVGQQPDLGQFRFENLIISGQFSFIMRAGSQQAQVALKKIHVVAADTRRYLEQPQKYGVNVLQGAMTIYNFNPDDESRIVVTAEQVTVGLKDAPVTGSGIFIAGFGDQGGRVLIEKLQTGAVYSTGRIPFGVADFITGAVFIVNGAEAKSIKHDGELVTYGVNDMVLDAWGTVEHWQVNAPVISYGPSGVGFVNFGQVRYFEMNDDILTYGLGARGYNQYDGTLMKGYFKNIKTFGDGAVGVQISKRVGEIIIDGNLETNGSVGNSLVKGVNVPLPAYALSLKTGGQVDSMSITGNLVTRGDKVVTYMVEPDSQVGQLQVAGERQALGKESLVESSPKQL